MVAGIESFIHKFSDYSDCYTIIGGAACDILMTEADTVSDGKIAINYTSTDSQNQKLDSLP